MCDKEGVFSDTLFSYGEHEMADVIGLKKITLREMGIDGAVAKVEKKAIDVADIWGIAHGLKAKTKKDTGEIFEAIVGNFEATNLLTGQPYSSDTLFLPIGHDRLAGQLYNKINDAGEVIEHAKPIKFGLRVIAVPSGNAAGFTYQLKMLAESGVNDPLTELRAQVQQKALELTANKPAAMIEAPKSELRGPDGKAKKGSSEEAKAAE